MTFDSQYAMFFMQFTMSFLGMSFSMFMITSGKQIDIYASILTSVVGYWLPSPVRLVSTAGNNREMATFAVQSLISMSTLVFSGYMLSIQDETSVFLPIFTSILAYWLPNPTFTIKTRDLDEALLDSV